jgi:hypothetical protein
MDSFTVGVVVGSLAGVALGVVAGGMIGFVGAARDLLHRSPDLDDKRTHVFIKQADGRYTREAVPEGRSPIWYTLRREKELAGGA